MNRLFPSRLVRPAALLLALALSPGPARAGLPVFDPLGWIEANLAKIEAWVQTALHISQGEWSGAALSGSSGLTALESLRRARTITGRGLSAARRLDSVRRSAQAIAANRALYVVPSSLTSATMGGTVRWFAVGDDWDWGEAQNSTKLDQMWGRLMTRQREAIERITTRAERRMQDARRDSPCSSGDFSCPEGQQVARILRAEMMVDLMKAQRAACEESARATARRRAAGLADESEPPDDADPDQMGTTTDGTVSGGTAADSRFENSQAGVLAGQHNLGLRQEQMQLAALREAIMLQDCSIEIPQSDIDETVERVEGLREALRQAQAARAAVASNLVSQARLYCEGRAIVGLRAHLAQQSVPPPTLHAQCVQDRLDELWDAAMVRWNADPELAALTPPVKPAVTAGWGTNP